MNTASVTISIVTYNSEQVIADCLRSIPKDVPIIVVDNASSDNTCPIISAEFPQVALIKLSENKGFGTAHNVALNTINTPYLFLLNPDAVLQKDCLIQLSHAAEQFSEAAILAPALLNESGTPQLSYNTPFYKRLGAGNSIIAEAPLCAAFISGAAMLMPINVMQALGGFDERIFLFYEDDDLCLRARKAGYSCVYVPAAKVMHIAGRSSAVAGWLDIKRKYRAMAYSELYVYCKYCSGYSTIAATFRSLMRALFKAITYSIIGKGDKAQKYAARFLGVMDFILGR